MDEFTFKKNGSIFVVIFFCFFVTQLKQIVLKFGFFPLESCTWIFDIFRCNCDYI